MGTTTFSSRLGFILVSAGCAIGLGNVWRFPFITGKYGGASFVVLYLIFLALLGLPIMVAEFAVGRASVHSPAKAFNVLEPKGTYWHKYKYIMIAGNVLLLRVKKACPMTLKMTSFQLYWLRRVKSGKR